MRQSECSDVAVGARAVGLESDRHLLVGLSPDVGPGPCRVSRNPVLDFVALAIIVLLVTVPFLDKAFHIDDVYYLQVSRHILKDPTRPYRFQLVADGVRQEAFKYVWSPPFFTYVLALGVLLFGESEVPLHCLMSLFTATVGISTYFLALRFCTRPLFVTIVVLMNPLFVAGQNLMLDVPMMALGLAGLTCHIWGTDRRSIRLVLFGGLLAGLAVVTKYPALLVLPLIGVYSWGKRSVLGLPALVVALVPMAVWCTQNLVTRGDLHFPGQSYNVYGATLVDVCYRMISVMTILGSGFFIVLLAPSLMLSATWRWSAWLGGLVAGASCVYGSPSVSFRDRQALEYAVFLASGLFLSAASVGTVWWCRKRVDARQHFDGCFLLLWLFAAVFMAIWAPFVAVRHLLWTLPAGAILLSRLLSPGWGTTAWVACGAAVLGAVGMAVGFADKELASIYRNEALYVLRSSSARDSAPTYYVGDGGFAYYCDLVGFERFGLNPTAMPSGTFVYIARRPYPAFPAALHGPVAGPVRVRRKGSFPMCTASDGVNFYALGRRDLPWDVGGAPEVRFHAYRLTASAAPQVRDGRDNPSPLGLPGAP